MSQPSHPVYTFQLNLEALNRLGHPLPMRTALAGNETVTEADQMKKTKSSYLASLFPGVEMIVHKDGESFTAYGNKAHYLKITYATGLPDAVLKVV